MHREPNRVRPEASLGFAGQCDRDRAARQQSRARQIDLYVRNVGDHTYVEFRCLGCEVLIKVNTQLTVTRCYEKYADQICPLCRQPSEPAEPATEPHTDVTDQI